MPWLLPVSWKPISCMAPWNQLGASAKGPVGFGAGTGTGVGTGIGSDGLGITEGTAGFNPDCRTILARSCAIDNARQTIASIPRKMINTVTGHTYSIIASS